jgi:cell division septal protein FtsQ|tara:strand:- start:105 stop:308 length:204 start_codon:yes stop_codon:yes gene_type:complete
MKLMASKKEKRSEYQEKLVPALFIVLFVVFMVAVFVYMNTSKKKYQAVPTVEISDEKKYHKSVILNF